MRMLFRAFALLFALHGVVLAQGGMMPGPGTAHSVSSSPTFTFLGSEGQVFGTTTATFTTINIGTARADRYIIVAIETQHAPTVTGVTVGGTSLASQVSQNPSRGVWIWSGLVATGSGAQNIVVTLSASDSAADCSILVWSGINMANTTGAANTGGNASASSITLTAANADFIIADLAFPDTSSGSTTAPTTTRNFTNPNNGTAFTVFEWNTLSSSAWTPGTIGLAGGAQSFIAAGFR